MSLIIPKIIQTQRLQSLTAYGQMAINRVIILDKNVTINIMRTKEEIIRFKIHPEEKNNIKAEATKLGLTMSKYIRSKLIKNYLNV